MDPRDPEDQLLQSVALSNAASILRARQRAEDELIAAKETLHQINQRMSNILESITDAFVVIDFDWNITYLNPRARQLLQPMSPSSEGLLGRNHWKEFPDLVGTELERQYRRAMEERVPAEIELFYPPLNSWFEVRAYPSRDGISVYFQDVTRRKEAETVLAAEKAALELIASGAPLERILERLTRDVEALSTDGMLCSVLRLDARGERLLHGAGPSLPKAYTEAIHGVALGPSVGSCGTAAFEKRAVVVEDIARDPLWKDFRDLARAHGLAACTSTPVLAASGEILGTVAAYYRSPKRPSRRDERLIATATRLAGIAMERERSESELRSSNARLEASFEQAAVGIAIASLDGRFMEMNRRFADILQYSQDELRGLTFSDVTYPEDLAATRANVARLLAGEIADYAMEKRYVRKGGAVAWSYTSVTLLRDAAGRPLHFVGAIENITPRKEAEERLRQSEAFSRSIVESSRDCIKTLDLKGTVLWMSEAGREALRIADLAQVLGKSWLDFWSIEERQSAAAALEAAARGETGKFVGSFEIAGEPRWWNVAITPIVDSSGNPESLLAISRDITDRIKAEEQVRRSEAQMRALADSIPQLAWMAEPDGHIFWYNEGWYRYTGTTPADMEGWGWQSVHDPEVLPYVLAQWRASLESGTPFEMEFPLRGADGQFRTFLTRVNPLRDDAGRVVRWFGTNTDVEHVKRTREALRDETRVLELLNETGIKLAANLDLQTVLQAVTDAATQLSGAAFGAFFYNTTGDDGDAFMLYTLSGAPRAAFEKFGQPRATPIFAPTFRGEAPIRLADVRADPRYGGMGPHHGMPPGHLPVRSYLAVPVMSRSGEVIGGLFFGHPEAGVFTERSERLIVGVAAQAAVAIDNARLFQAAQKAAEERERLLESERGARTESERASHMKDEFLATLSHELRTPLSSILGWSQLLRSGARSEADLQKGLDVIERNARTQTQLIEDLLDMSRIISGKVRLDIRRVEPATFIEAAVETVRPAAEARDVRLETVLDSAPCVVSGDPARLQQVVWNLLSNAIKFTPKGGKVQVVLERVNSHVEISVADTGVGIDPRFIDHVFERFRQADASTTRRYGGLGLGLSIVKNLVELHGGNVQAHSAGEGRGATFTVHLPVAIATRFSEEGRLHPTAPAAETLAAAAIDLGGVKVLVVDDQDDARELLARVLSECRAEVLTASNAEDALQLIQAQRPQVLVSDIGMPRVDGYELLRRVRALPESEGGRTPAIALTAFARSEDRTRALRAGFLVHVSKPVEPSELIATVASVAGRAAT